MEAPIPTSELIQLLEHDAAPESIEIREASAEELDEIIAKLPDSRTTSVHVVDMNLHHVEAAFWSCLQNLDYLVELAFTTVPLPVHSAKNLAETVLPRLLSLRIDNCKLGPRGLKALAPGIPQTLENLTLRNVNMDHYGAQALGSVLPPNLRTLDISFNKKLGPEGIWKLSTQLDDLSRLETLNLNSSLIDNDGAVELARHLPSLKSLKGLFLSHNRIGPMGTESLSQGFKNIGSSHNQLRTLDLSNNVIENEGAAAIGRALINCPELAYLYLSKNGIGDDGCSALVKGIADAYAADSETDDSEHKDHNDGAVMPSSKLQLIDLSGNSIGDRGAQEFVEHLEHSNVADLRLQNNCISEARTHILNMLLRHRESSLLSPVRSKSSRVNLSGMVQALDLGDRVGDDSTDVSVKSAGMPVNMDLVDQAREELDSSYEASEIAKISIDYLRHTLFSKSKIETIGDGAFGKLYKLIDGDKSYWVREIGLSAVSTRMQEVRESILKEMERVDAEDLVTPTAYCCSTATFYFIRPADGGYISLHDILANKASRETFGWNNRLAAMISLTTALEYLHQSDGVRQSMFHGDIHPANVWIHPTTGHTQLSDAVMSRLLATDKEIFISGDVVWSRRGYRCVRYERGSCGYSQASDVFSLGVVVAEILTGILQGTPANTENGLGSDIYYDVVLSGGKLVADLNAGPITGTLMEIVGRVIVACCNPTPSRRPSATTLKKMMATLLL